MLGLLSTAVLLALTYVTGRHFEQQHFQSIRAREQRFLSMVTSTLGSVPQQAPVARAEMVTGSVVISLDYFKRFLAGLRVLIGGRIKAYEPLLDRARREALLRMREEAARRGYDMVINVRLETSRLASSGRDGKGTAGVEMLAFGTAIKLAPAPPASQTHAGQAAAARRPGEPARQPPIGRRRPADRGCGSARPGRVSGGRVLRRVGRVVLAARHGGRDLPFAVAA